MTDYYKRRNRNGRRAESGAFSAVESYLDNSKPREERDYKEYYPDLDQERKLRVYIDTNEYDGSNSRAQQMQRLQLKEPIFLDITDMEDIKPKITKLMLKYGYNDSNSESKSLEDTYIRGDHSQNLENVVAYDMDEHDVCFLNRFNLEKSKDNCVSNELFEILITTLENEWYKLEKRIPPRIRTDFNQHLTATTSHINIYGSDDGTGCSPEQDQCCAVCNESECDNSNAIVFCDGCDIAVHQECYGVAFIPEGQWLCRRCMISRKRRLHCLFCPSTTGAFKQTDNSLWGHVICSLWINELYFANPVYMEPIEGVDLIPKSRWKLNCYICRQKVGACIQCSNKNCFQAFHVTCARRSELFLEMKNGLQGALANKGTVAAYCDKHGPHDWNLTHDVKTGIERTRLYFTTINLLKDKNDRRRKSQKESNKKNIFKWKTKSGTPLAPSYFLAKVEHILEEFHVESRHEIALSICRYWVLKRELKKGAPLIRRVESTQYGTVGSEEITERAEFSSILSQDIDKLEGLTEQLVKRQEKMLEEFDTNLDLIQKVYFPLTSILNSFMDRLYLLDPSKVLLRFANTFTNEADLKLADLQHKINTFMYSSITEFQEEFEQFLAVVRNNKPPISVRKVLLNIGKEQKKLFNEAFETEEQIQDQLNEHGMMNYPFVKVDGSNVEFARWSGWDIDDLSEPEELDEEFLKSLKESEKN